MSQPPQEVGVVDAPQRGKKPRSAHRLSEWEAQLTRAIASRITYWRTRGGSRRLSAQQLADRCSELGYDIPRSTLTNLENGRLRNITLGELLVIARALEVPPLALATPVGPDAPLVIEVLPGVPVSPIEALMWIIGERAVPGTPDYSRVDEVTGEAGAALMAARQHNALEFNAVAAARTLGRLLGDTSGNPTILAGARDDASNATRQLLRHRDSMRTAGWAVPPLPADLAHLEE